MLEAGTYVCNGTFTRVNILAAAMATITPFDSSTARPPIHTYDISRSALSGLATFGRISHNAIKVCDLQWQVTSLWIKEYFRMFKLGRLVSVRLVPIGIDVCMFMVLYLASHYVCVYCSTVHQKFTVNQSVASWIELYLRWFESLNKHECGLDFCSKRAVWNAMNWGVNCYVFLLDMVCGRNIANNIYLLF